MMGCTRPPEGWAETSRDLVIPIPTSLHPYPGVRGTRRTTSRWIIAENEQHDVGVIVDYKGRLIGLILFGILEIFIGIAVGLIACFMWLGVVAGTGPGGPPPRLLAPIARLSFAVAIGFIIFGLGSIMARRWARALILALSWLWLITGVLSSIGAFAILPQVFEQRTWETAAQHAAVRNYGIGCVSVISGLFLILLPLAFVLFYRSSNVRATVEARDRVHRWTDDVPGPLLSFGVWMIGGAAATLIFSFMYPSLPLGPWMIRGAAVPAVMLAFFALMLFIGVGSLKRKQTAWWAALALFMIGAGWAVLFVTRTNVAVWCRDLGIDPYSGYSLYSHPWFFAWLAVFWAAYLTFLFYLRRYFWPPTGNAQLAA